MNLFEIMLYAIFGIIVIIIIVLAIINYYKYTKLKQNPIVKCVHKDKKQYHCEIYHYDNNNILIITPAYLCQACIKTRTIKGDLIVL